MQIAGSKPRRDIHLTTANSPDHAFASLGGAARARFNAIGMEMGFRRGGLLLSADEMPHFIFMLRNGRVKLSVTSIEGKTITFRIAESGQVLGLRAALNASKLEASAEALELCRVTAIPVKDFLRFLEDFPGAAMHATRCILQEYQVVFDDIRRLAQPETAAGRLAALLLNWVKRRRKKGVMEPRLTMMLTHEEIGAMTGTSRETVSRIFQQFKRERLISIKGPSLILLRTGRLEQIAAGPVVQLTHCA